MGAVRAPVEALFAPPEASMSLSNSPFGTRSVPMNMRCSKRCAKPLRRAGSSLLPTRYQMLIVAVGSV